MNADIFLNCFEDALQLVGTDYYGVELCTEQLLNDMGVDNYHPQVGKIRKYLSRYGERSFCYELYRHIRNLMEEYLEANPNDQIDPPLLLQGELKKHLVSDIIDIIPGFNEELSKEYIPDFLLHTPGPYSLQEVVVEIKSSPKLAFSGIGPDLSKMQEFIDRYNYQLGLFLAVNSEPDRIIENFNSEENINWINENIHSKDRIIILLKHNKETELVKFYLNDVPTN